MAVEARVPLIVKDPKSLEKPDLQPIEWYRVRSEGVLLDGPVSPRVAVLDLDADTGRLRPGTPFRTPGGLGAPGEYVSREEKLADLQRLDDDDVLQVSTFGAVLKTLEMFEEDDALGRRVRWAFEGPQLLVVPRAGEWENAFYERESRSLQFFYFHATRDSRQRIYTCQSQDIVAHETAHAVLDGIAPDLYHALSPQSLALHEAVADLTAALAAFRCRPLYTWVLARTGGSIERTSAFSGLGGQFSTARGGGPYLRNLLNQKTLRPHATSKPSDVVTSVQPHELSQVLSGALYSVLVHMHEALKDEFAGKDKARGSLAVPVESELQAPPVGDAEDTEEATPEQRRWSARRRVSGKALAVATSRFKRTLYRGLDYLPPGEVSFADFGRALIAADQASHPDSGEQREWLCREFVRRGIVRSARRLHVRTGFEYPALKRVNLETLVASDWAAYRFANHHRRFLRIPRGHSFHVEPRLVVEKLHYSGPAGRTRVRECIFKVSWKRGEPCTPVGELPGQRQVTFGTMLAIDWETRTVRALLTSDRSAVARQQRDRLLLHLKEKDLLRLGADALGPDGQPLSGVIHGEVSEGVLRVVGTAHMLHLVEAGLGGETPDGDAAGEDIQRAVRRRDSRLRSGPGPGHGRDGGAARPGGRGQRPGGRGR
jgi:hypothetical protein